jgi:transposase
VTDERLRFVVAASRAEKPLKALAEEFGISRQTGHLWLNRYQEEGASGVLAERSRAPHRRPAESSETVVEAVLELRRRWPDWGARKLHVLLGQQRPELKVSRTTVHRIMDRNGLIYPCARHKPAVQRFERAEPNILWQMDFKGPKGFRQRSGPLSLLDDHSRYLLALQHLENARAAAVQNCLHKVFENNGLPDQMLIRSRHAMVECQQSLGVDAVERLDHASGDSDLSQWCSSSADPGQDRAHARRACGGYLEAPGRRRPAAMAR